MVLIHFLNLFQCKKTASEVLKTCYFPYSVFWSADQWEFEPRLPGYATESNYFEKVEQLL